MIIFSLSLDKYPVKKNCQKKQDLLKLRGKTELIVGSVSLRARMHLRARQSLENIDCFVGCTPRNDRR